MNQVLQNWATLLLAGAMTGTLAACGGGADAGSSLVTNATAPVSGQPADPVPPSVARIGVLPSNAMVALSSGAIAIASGGSLQFTVEVLPLGASNAVTWTASGPACAGAACGTVDAGNRYVAPAVPPGSPITLTARSVTTPTQAATASITVGPQSAGVFTAAGNMIAARSGHTATLLSDGRVLIAGGSDDDLPGSAELYDPASGTFVATGNMRAPRSSHTATLLASGQVLIVGPETSSGVELYDPASNTFLPTGAMRTQQGIRTATLLNDGRVLVAGDINAEIYDASSRTFQSARPYAVDAYHSTATRLNDGRVLFVGDGPAQIYDPAGDIFTVAGSPDYFEQHSATLLGSGEVLIAGGSNSESPGGRISTAVLYDPRSGLFGGTGSMVSARAVHAAVTLPDGEVLMLGGDGISCAFISLHLSPAICEFAGSLTSAELYSPSTGAFAAVGDMNVARSLPRATLLRNGAVLITGGMRFCGINCFDARLASAELYRPR